MSKTAIWIGAVVLCAAGVSVSAQGQSKAANLKVTAEVVANCNITTADMAFGTYDPVGANASTPLDARGQISFQCTSGAHYTFTLDAGQNSSGTQRSMANGATRLNYDMYLNNAHNLPLPAGHVFGATGDGTLKTYTVYGRIPPGQSVPAGSYVDNILVTVNF